MVKIDNGKFLEIGLKGKNYETKNGVIQIIIYYLLATMLMFYLAYLAYQGNGEIFGSNEIAFIVTGGFGFALILILLTFPGAEIDGIYENGLTHSHVGILKRLQGKHWIPWNEVEKIYYGDFHFNDKKRGISEYVKIISGNKETFWLIKSNYEKLSPNYYPLLIKMLKEKSLQAKWIPNDE